MCIICDGGKEGWEKGIIKVVNADTCESQVVMAYREIENEYRVVLRFPDEELWLVRWDTFVAEVQ